MNAIFALLALVLTASNPQLSTSFHARVRSEGAVLNVDLPADGVVRVGLPADLIKDGWACGIAAVQKDQGYWTRSIVCKRADLIVGATALCFTNQPDFDDQRFGITTSKTMVSIELACTTKPLD